MILCIYDDAHTDGFYPLTELRPLWSLRAGAFTIGERLRRLFPGLTAVFLSEPGKPQAPVTGDDAGEPYNPRIHGADSTLFVNSRWWANRQSAAAVTVCAEDTVFTVGDQTAAVLTRRPTEQLVQALTKSLPLPAASDLARKQIPGRMLTHLWDLLQELPQTLADDLDSETTLTASDAPIPNDVLVRGGGNVRVGSSVRLGPGVMINAEHHRVILGSEATLGVGVIIDASEGTVWIDTRARVEAGAVIQGPVYLGPYCIVRAGARLAESALGPQCRVGGEVSRSIIQSFTNKQHSGYLGNSFLGSWVNLGAATDTSDLKNNYRPVKVSLRGTEVDTGSLHIGALIGDFTRTAIHTRLNTGAVVGVCCQIHMPDFPPRELPAFTWAAPEGLKEYILDKALETIAQVMPRRGKTLTPELQGELAQLFARTAAHRRAAGITPT